MSAKEFNKDIDTRSDPVRDKLLDAAEKLFAEKGFDGTSVRDITAEAKCNVAAVNYHFGGKDNLYTETFRRKLILLRDVRVTRIDEVMARGGETTLEDLLRAFGKAFFEPLVGVSSGPRFIKLWLREMLDQRLPATMLVEETFRPVLGSRRPLLRCALVWARQEPCHRLTRSLGSLFTFFKCTSSGYKHMIHQNSIWIVL